MRQYLVIALLLTGFAAQAQDYYADRNNTTSTPIYFQQNGAEKKNMLFSAGVNVSDATAAKVNIYNQYWNNPAVATVANVKYTNVKAWGWGASLNAETKSGLGKLFKSGNFDPGFTGGAYLSRTVFKTEENNGTLKSRSHTFILSSNIAFAAYQFYNPSAAFADQLSSKNFTSPSVGFSYVNQPALAKDDLFWGFSISWKKVNNYDDLDTYTISNDYISTSGDISRKASKINPNGDTYAMGEYSERSNFKLRFNTSYIPASFGYRFGVIFYPSVDVGGPNPRRVNAGISFNYLQDKAPTISIFAINMELNDMTNSFGSTKTFLKRSFKVGISTNLNLLVGPK